MMNALIVLCLVTVGVNGVFTPTNDPNMNGEYKLSPTPNAPPGQGFPTNFKDYPGGVEYMEVYHGPITSTYGQVFWTTLSNDLPQDIVDRFAGKAMAIVGYEIDQVRKTPEGDVSVPITLAYNHHHDTAVVGTGSHMETMDRNDPRIKGRNYVRLDKGKAWVPVEHEPSKKGVPTSAMFSDGNGGEYRKTFHALAPPYAQIVESPQRLSGSPMQIDTWNRDKMNLTGSKFVPGPVPKHSLAPTDGPDAVYSGLLECPLTTRIQKIIEGNGGFNDTYFAQIFTAKQGCEHAVSNASECFASAHEVQGLTNATITTRTVNQADLPSGCSVSSNAEGSIAQFTFNTMQSSTTCAASETSGSVQAFVGVKMNLSSTSNVATVTLTGPSDVWFGIGLNASIMADLPYAIIVDGTGNVTERKMGNHEAGTQLATSVKVISNTVVNGVRTVVVSRPLVGMTPEHYTFEPSVLAVDFINAIGSTSTFGYHKVSGVSTINLWPANNGAACVCKEPAAAFGSAKGVIKYLPTGESIGFMQGRCSPYPRTDLINQRNPTCDIRAYTGGLETCHHHWTLLDADQDIPWQDQPLTYYKKFRIYFQEYNESFHVQANRQDWGIGADGDHAEYDVPQCAPGTPTSECNHTISGTWMVHPSDGPKMGLVLAHFHCHAPTCLRVELWNNDTGKLLCGQNPIYGGTGQVDDPRFDEAGYIAVPPCMWGSAEHGLESPPVINGMTVKVVAVTNSTYGHHGEMALPEISYAPL